MPEPLTIPVTVGGAVASDDCGDTSWLDPVIESNTAGCGNTRTVVAHFVAQHECGRTTATN